MTAITAKEPGAEPAEVDQRVGALRAAVTTFVANKLAVGSLVILLLIILFCFVGPLVYHTDQVSAQLLLENQPPSAAHILGTSPAGRDELGRLMLGGQSTIELGLAVGLLASAFGLVWGTISGFVGGMVDSVMMRIVDALLSIPFLFFVILLASIVRPTLWLIILVISGVSWLSTARLVRGETLSLKTRDYVVAAAGFGAPRWRLIARHIMPNVLGVLVVNGTLKVADAILTFAALGYLGLSIPPPATNWGEILAGGVNNIFDGYWWQLWPAAVLIVLTVLAVNVLGDALRDVVESRLAQH
ncbi:MAG: ABC transporter permease [Ferrimicrobium sp.]|uniref:ABC transporter permease n=1 Tax=Ferrimicrobium sp. TaxID=2926050 RepID=UPI00260D3738|nr:ABC transporter permease [Ferrimicrobium sp.]